MINLIVAMDRNNAIGKDNSLLIHDKEDMQYFKKHTLGQVVVMGRKTYESIGGSLKGRKENIVLTRQKGLKLQDVTVLNSVEDVLKHCKGHLIWVIGGSEIYKEFESVVNEIYVTHYDTVVDDADAFFSIDLAEWTVVRSEEGMTGIPKRFKVYKRLCM